MKILLAGTPEFSVKVFEKIINNFEVVAIVTQPDKPKGRNQKIIESPVKKLAKNYNIKVLQPKKIKEIKGELQSLDFDIFLSCAYGQIIPEYLLNIAKKASLNIHASLLPKYRGAAPIHYSILNGDKETGISLIYMIKKMDAGDIIFQSKITIKNSDTTGKLFKKLSIVASENIVSWLNKVVINNIYPIKQNNKEVIFSPKISKEECEITNDKTTIEAQRMIKAFNPFPGAFIIKNNIKYKIIDYGSKGIEYKTNDGSLFITEIQAPSKKPMNYKEFLRGNKF